MTTRDHIAETCGVYAYQLNEALQQDPYALDRDETAKLTEAIRILGELSAELER